jgi:toxin ParE1/3/4
MKTEVQLSEEAEEDLFESYVWYERKRSSLGDEFLSQIQKTLDTITNSPESYPIRYRKMVRAFVVDRFPFLILFIKKESLVEVISIFHTSRNPKIWKNRV